jgi:hypothetical protein
MKVGENVITLQNGNNDNSPYTEMILCNRNVDTTQLPQGMTIIYSFDEIFPE